MRLRTISSPPTPSAKSGSESSPSGHALDEQLDLILDRRRADRIRPLDDPAVRLEPDRHVLTGAVRQLGVGANPDDPEIRGRVATRDDGCRGVLLRIDHERGESVGGSSKRASFAERAETVVQMYGPLALVGGDEFHPGNERQDEILRDACAGRPAYIVATAAQDYAAGAVETARNWFAVWASRCASCASAARRTRARRRSSPRPPRAGLVYIAGGDPGCVVEVLRASPVWKAIAAAWRAGAALAGSSAGAMALCEWCLVQTSWPGEIDERSVDALGLIPGCAILPHFDVLGDAWVPWAQEGLDERRPRWSGSTSAPPRCCATAAGRCSDRALSRFCKGRCAIATSKAN